MRDPVPDLVVFSHLRWDFVYQRPQHLLSRHAKVRRVFYIEEPIFDAELPRFERRVSAEGVTVLVPHLSSPDQTLVRQQMSALLEPFQRTLKAGFTAWYYTPMALTFTAGLRPAKIIYDCMDELSMFRGAPAELCHLEEELLSRADLVFTGGRSLFEAKRKRHPSVHLFASSIETAHFERARRAIESPSDQAALPGPRLGFYGVIDERLDLELIEAAARLRPDWTFVMIGPVVKIDPHTLPRPSNVHWLGMKTYAELPAYLAGWDVALLPFALNESTRFISPTKTLEYLAAGKPVVSTPIHDVVEPYQKLGLAQIAGTTDEFVSAIAKAMTAGASAEFLRRADQYLATTSWDKTFKQMLDLEVSGPTLNDHPRVNYAEAAVT